MGGGWVLGCSSPIVLSKTCFAPLEPKRQKQWINKITFQPPLRLEIFVSAYFNLEELSYSMLKRGKVGSRLNSIQRARIWSRISIRAHTTQMDWCNFFLTKVEPFIIQDNEVPKISNRSNFVVCSIADNAIPNVAIVQVWILIFRIYNIIV